MLQGEMINYWQMKEVLPSGLDALKNEISGFVPPRDPETNSPYEYKVISPLKFQLCATFNLASIFASSEMNQPVVPAPYKGYYDTSNEVWNHETGSKCFERTIDPELYPKLVR